ncbi:hypothetical protein BVRB_8g189940 [Beta vulgaris subsp. vulgaris]|nr:hypothetical protein BVRB_8g189940 [Beta vulgaris subsp. vulgaris]
MNFDLGYFDYFVLPRSVQSQIWRILPQTPKLMT